MELSGGYLLFLDCFTWDLLFSLQFLFSFAMRLLQVRASPFVQRRKILPFRSPRETQQGRINRPLHRKSHGQGFFDLMFFVMFVVYSLLVLALVFLSMTDKDMTWMQNSSLKIASFNINGVLNPVRRGKILSTLKKTKSKWLFCKRHTFSEL